MGNTEKKLEDHEVRIRKLEKTISEIKGELRLNTLITVTILAGVLGLILVSVS